jgi:hypothetical protein
MKRVLVLLIALALAGCGESSEEVWGGYTESEAKDILKDPDFRRDIVSTAPPTAAGPVERLYPTDEEGDDADLRKATVQGEEAWEYKREVDFETVWCIYISEDPQAEGEFLAQVGPCYAG